MSSWSKAGKEVRLILFECLNRPEAKNNYFNPVQCAELCNLAAGLDFCRGIDSLRIGRAFSNGGKSDYSLQFNQLIFGSDATHFYMSSSINEWMEIDILRLVASRRK
jgi:hypothetical protein